MKGFVWLRKMYTQPSRGLLNCVNEMLPEDQIRHTQIQGVCCCLVNRGTRRIQQRVLLWIFSWKLFRRDLLLNSLKKALLIFSERPLSSRLLFQRVPSAQTLCHCQQPQQSTPCGRPSLMRRWNWEWGNLAWLLRPLWQSTRCLPQPWSVLVTLQLWAGRRVSSRRAWATEITTSPAVQQPRASWR